MARSGAGSSSIAAYRNQYGQLEEWLWKLLAKATERDLAELKAKLRTKPSGKHHVNLLRMFYKASRQGNLRELCILKQRTHKLQPDEILTVRDVEAMFKSASSLRDRAFIAVLWETGVRIHEVLAVDLENVKEGEADGKPLYTIWFSKTKIAGEEHVGCVLEGASLSLPIHARTQGRTPRFCTARPSAC